MEDLEGKSQEFLWVAIRPWPNGGLPKAFKSEGGVQEHWVVLAEHRLQAVQWENKRQGNNDNDGMQFTV